MKPIDLRTLIYCIVVAIIYYASIELLSLYINSPYEGFMGEFKVLMNSKIGADLLKNKQ